jgi:ethanolamine ammonia-lyase small subunit
MDTWTYTALTIVLAPAFSFAGAYLGYRRARAADLALDRWRRREETMRMVRWAADHALADDEALRPVGVSALAALRRAELLQPEDERLVEEIAEAVAIVTAEGPGYPMDAEIVVSEDGEEDPTDG